MQYSEHITNNTEAGRYIIELSQTEDVLMAYNDVVRLYLNPRNTQETKRHISRIIVSLEDMISDIVQIINSIVKHLYDNKKLTHTYQLVYALTLYQIIQDQLSKGKFYIIHINDIKHDYDIKMKNKTQSKMAAPIVYDMTADDGAEDVQAKDMKRRSRRIRLTAKRPQPTEPKSESEEMPPLEVVPSSSSIKPSYIVSNININKGGTVKRPGWIQAIKYYNSLPTTTGKIDINFNQIEIEHLRLLVRRYITLRDGDNNELNTIQGEGAPSQPDIIQSTPPALLYDDVKSDPYFITG